MNISSRPSRPPFSWLPPPRKRRTSKARSPRVTWPWSSNCWPTAPTSITKGPCWACAPCTTPLSRRTSDGGAAARQGRRHQYQEERRLHAAASGCGARQRGHGVIPAGQRGHRRRYEQRQRYASEPWPRTTGSGTARGRQVSPPRSRGQPRRLGCGSWTRWTMDQVPIPAVSTQRPGLVQPVRP